MKVELNRQDIIAMLKGTCPNFTVMNSIPEELGYFGGNGFDPQWHWNNFSTNVKYTDQELYEMYIMCRDSWR